MARNGAAGDLVDELEALAARQRLHLDDAIAELAVAAGLLLVTAAHFRVLAQAFLVRRRWRRGGDFDTEAALQPIEHDAQMRLALALQQDFVRRLIVHDVEAGVFFDQLLQRAGETHVVLAVLGGDGELIDREALLEARA